MKKTDSPRSSERMGAEAEGRLLFRLALPMVISMLVQALYNVVDSVFVARVSENALTAVSLGFPMQMLMVAVAVGTGVGLNALISTRLGEKRYEKANEAAANGLMVMLLSAAVFSLFGLFGARPFIAAYTDDPELLEYGGQYLSICATFGLGVFVAIATERIMQAQGKATWSMLIQLAGALTNLILDPILIFGLLGFPVLGVRGAAIATVLGQMVSMALGLIVIFSGRNEVRPRLRGFQPSWEAVRGIYSVGLPNILMQSLGTVMNLAMNAILIAFTPTAVAVFGVYYKLQSIIFMPVFGITGASMSILAYNYGARSRPRLMRTYGLTVWATAAIMTAGTVLFHLFPDVFLRMFDASDNMMAIGTKALRIISVIFPVAAVCISTSVLFQAVGNGFYSMLMSLIRQLLVLVPAALILSRLSGDLDMVWWAFPIAEGVGLITTMLLMKRLYRLKIQPISADRPPEAALEAS